MDTNLIHDVGIFFERHPGQKDCSMTLRGFANTEELEKQINLESCPNIVIANGAGVIALFYFQNQQTAEKFATDWLATRAKEQNLTQIHYRLNPA